MKTRAESGPRRRDRRDDDEKGSRGGRFIRKKFCRFCSEKVSFVDYKDVERLAKFLTERGKIIARRITGTCATHQRGLARAIKRSRHTALLPFQAE
jgi:small subunit ribosomal protein S18